MFTTVSMVTWVDVGGGCYRVVLEHGSTLKLDGLNVLVIHACQFHVSRMLIYLLQLSDVGLGL